MAKFSYTKLNAKVDQSTKEIIVEGVETPIEVLQYLPINDKLALIGRVIELSHDDNNFSNPVKAEVYKSIEMVEAYTNITFTDKQKENLPKLYDSLCSSGWMNKIFEAIPDEEKETLDKGLKETIKAYYKYRNSILGILDTIKTDYSDLDLDITNLQSKLRDGDNLELVKDILSKLG